MHPLESRHSLRDTLVETAWFIRLAVIGNGGTRSDGQAWRPFQGIVHATDAKAHTHPHRGVGSRRKPKMVDGQSAHSSRAQDVKRGNPEPVP